MRAHQLVCNADSDDRPNHGVRTRCRKAEVPRPEIPQDCCNQKSEDHRIACAGTDLKDQLDRQQRDDAEGDCAARIAALRQRLQKTGPDDCNVRIERVRVDNRRDRIRRVVEAVYKLEAESNQQGDGQQERMATS